MFQICSTRQFRCINHGPKLGELNGPTENQLWFWDPIRAYGLHDLLYTEYSFVIHAMITTLCKRWHPETSSFHLPVGEMAITLDDAINLSHFLIEGCMLDYDRKVSRDRGVQLMVRWLGVSRAICWPLCFCYIILLEVIYSDMLFAKITTLDYNIIYFFSHFDF